MKDAGFTNTKPGLMLAPLTLTGDYATGVRGLAQRFMTLMLANPETGVRTHGGGLSKSTISSSMGVEAIKNTINISLVDVLRYMQSQELATDPDDERVGTAVISSIDIPTPDALNLTFTITSLAGTTSTAATTV